MQVAFRHLTIMHTHTHTHTLATCVYSRLTARAAILFDACVCVFLFSPWQPVAKGLKTCTA
uniref:Uncharacterized protein n=1 Tax=Daphnia magna TaxID=35525 RepID=A0A0P5VZC8_9CRUS